MTPRPTLTTTQRRIVGTVAVGAALIAGIGFAGSYAAVRALALHKGFGWFATVFPIGIDAGIVVLLSLDLLLTWLRIPFPLIRHTAWLLTAATIAFNAATAWPDPLGVGMHAVIPILFVVSVEAARHATGRIADITADRHMESVRLARWILAPWPTFRLWRRMKLWELRSYNEVIGLERDRLIYRAQLRARYGRAWRRKAPVEALMPLRLARLGASVTASPAAYEAPRRLTVICSGPTGVLAAPHFASSRAALPAVAESAASSVAPQPRITICGRHIGALTVPPHLRKPTTPNPAGTPATPGAAPVMRAGQSAAAQQSRIAVAPSRQRRPATASPASPAASSAAFDRHADDALRLAGMTKAAAVRVMCEAHPGVAAPQIAALLTEHGIKATASYVRTVQSRKGKAKRGASGTGQYL